METNTQPMKYDVTEAKLAEIEVRFGTLPDAMTKDGYSFLAEGVREIKGYIANTEKLRVSQNADALSWQRAVNAKAKSIKAKLVSVRDKLLSAKKVKDNDVERIKEEKRQVEEERKKTIIAMIGCIQAEISHATGKPAAEIESIARELDTRDVTGFEEFTDQAKKVKLETVNILWDMHTLTQANEDAEKQRIEKDAQDAEAKKQEQEKHEAEAVKIKEETARLDKERKAFELDRKAHAEAARKQEAEWEAKTKALAEQEALIKKEKAEAAAKQEAAERKRIEAARADAIAKHEAEEKARREEAKKKAGQAEKKAVEKYIGDLPAIVEQLESCGYECESGMLVRTVAFVALKQMAEKG